VLFQNQPDNPGQTVAHTQWQIPLWPASYYQALTRWIEDTSIQIYTAIILLFCLTAFSYIVSMISLSEQDNPTSENPPYPTIPPYQYPTLPTSRWLSTTLHPTLGKKATNTRSNRKNKKIHPQSYYNNPTLRANQMRAIHSNKVYIPLLSHDRIIIILL